MLPPNLVPRLPPGPPLSDGWGNKYIKNSVVVFSKWRENFSLTQWNSKTPELQFWTIKCFRTFRGGRGKFHTIFTIVPSKTLTKHHILTSCACEVRSGLCEQLDTPSSSDIELSLPPASSTRARFEPAWFSSVLVRFFSISCFLTQDNCFKNKYNALASTLKFIYVNSDCSKFETSLSLFIWCYKCNGGRFNLNDPTTSHNASHFPHTTLYPPMPHVASQPRTQVASRSSPVWRVR